MRSVFSLWPNRGPAPAGAELSQRPEVMRQTALGLGARLLLVASALAAIPGIYGLVMGEAVVFLVSVIGLTGAVFSLASARREDCSTMAATQVASLLSIGAVLSVAEPALTDFGLAIAVMGPVLAALLGGPRTRRMSWIGLAGIGIVVVAAHLAGVGADKAGVTSAAALTFLATAGLIVLAASRVARAYEMFDKGQLEAYRHLVENVRDAVLRFSNEGEVLFASHSAETLFGCRRFELTARALGERIHVGDRPAYLTAFADANQGGIAREIEVRIRRQEGAEGPVFLWTEICLSPVPAQAGPDMPSEVVGVFRDITERRRQDAEAAAARAAAEEASYAKSRFLATIGHELRTPLNAVVGFSEMMVHGIGGELGPTHKEYAGLIHQSGRHLLDVVGMLLDMSKIEAGKFEIQPEAFDPAALIEPCFAMVEQLARERQISLRSEIAPDLPSLNADERACRQILINLLSNAVKFSHTGKSVTIAVKRQGMAINFSVIDQGIGMDVNAVSRIGEPFFQANAQLDRKHEGTGLGLSIVKGLVELHGGTLRAVSEIGGGTVMTVLLPINGPETLSMETATVTPLLRDPIPVSASQWPDGKRKAL